MSAPALLSFILILLHHVCSEIQFESASSNQQWYPSFVLRGASGSCSETVSNIYLYHNTYASWYVHNQKYYEDNYNGYRYAWNYSPDDGFTTPISIYITKSNGETIYFSNVITYWSTSATFPTGVDWCPSPTTSPTPLPSSSPTKQPSPSPTTLPTLSPSTSSPTIFPTAVPSDSPTLVPTQSPTDSPSPPPNSIIVTLTPTDTPGEEGKNPTHSPSSKPTSAPNINANATIKDVDFLGMDHSILIPILGVAIGVLACCIMGLFMCWCHNRRQQQLAKLAESDDDDDNTEIAKIMMISDSDTHQNMQNNIMAMDGTLDVTSPNSIQSVHSASPVSSMQMPMGDTMWLKMWLDSIHLGQYLDLFIEHGFGDQIATISTLTDHDLLGMGIVSQAHRQLILSKVELLKINGMPGIPLYSSYNNNSNVQGLGQYLNPNSNSNQIDRPHLGDGFGNSIPSEIESVATFPISPTNDMSPQLEAMSHTAEGPAGPDGLQLGGIESESVVVNDVECAGGGSPTGSSSSLFEVTANFISD